MIKLYMNTVGEKAFTKKKTRKNSLNIERICSKIVADTERVGECILYNEREELKQKELDFEWLIETYTDKTGIEMGFSEIIFHKNEMSSKKGRILGVELARKLAKKFSVPIGVLVSYPYQCRDKWKFMTVRFHEFREEEGAWINLEEIEHFDNCLCYVIYE